MKLNSNFIAIFILVLVLYLYKFLFTKLKSLNASFGSKFSSSQKVSSYSSKNHEAKSYTNTSCKIFEVNTDGTIFISDGLRGGVREAAMKLTKFGFHVLIGVKNEDERRSFAFDLKKGAETIIFDISDPSTYPELIYRLRKIRNFLHRPLVGVVLNLVDYVEEHHIERDILRLDKLDQDYQYLVKGPTRLIQAIKEMGRYQLDEFPNSSHIFDGIRITSIVTNHIFNKEKEEFCGMKCSMEQSFIASLSNQISRDNSLKNISFSVIKKNIYLYDKIFEKNHLDLDVNKDLYRKNLQNIRYELFLHQNMHLSKDLNDTENESSTFTINSIIDSMTSNHPKPFYE